MGYELEDRDILRDTPEGELWTSVLVDALEDLQGSAKWLDEVYEARRERLEGAREAGEGSPARHRERMRDLERERAERKAQIVSCTRFFFDEDSPPLPGVLTVLPGYRYVDFVGLLKQVQERRSHLAMLLSPAQQDIGWQQYRRDIGHCDDGQCSRVQLFSYSAARQERDA